MIFSPEVDHLVLLQTALQLRTTQPSNIYPSFPVLLSSFNRTWNSDIFKNTSLVIYEAQTASNYNKIATVYYHFFSAFFGFLKRIKARHGGYFDWQQNNNML